MEVSSSGESYSLESLSSVLSGSVVFASLRFVVCSFVEEAWSLGRVQFGVWVLGWVGLVVLLPW